MLPLRATTLGLIGVGLVCLTACVELTGQRISWFHDEAADELRILIHYDGIHESEPGPRSDGDDDLRTFVTNGDVLIMDWPFHLNVGALREESEDPEAEVMEREGARLYLDSVRTKVIGFYREPDGRVGAAQRVVISEVQAFVRSINDLINLQVLQGKIDEDASNADTERRIRAAAMEGHPWISLDGQAIRVTVPIHPGEWARVKGEFFQGLLEDLGQDDEYDYGPPFWMQALGSVPFSYIESTASVTFVLGSVKGSSTLRLPIRGEYEPSLEATVREMVPTDLDAILARTLRADGPAPDAAIADLLAWGPPEDQVRALVGAVKDEGGSLVGSWPRLERWGNEWNAREGIPASPPGINADAMDDTLAAWTGWYHRMKWFPGPVEMEIGAELGAAPGRKTKP